MLIEIDDFNGKELLSQLKDQGVVATEIGAWQPIETAPMDRPILIRENKNQPDFVRWKKKRPERIVGGTKYLAIPAGWFRLYGSRSHIIDPTEWLNIPK